MLKVVSLYLFILVLEWKLIEEYPLFFSIKLHIIDIFILEKIKYTLGVGKIRKTGINMVVYTVESFKDLELIIDHFDQYPLISAKISDYLLFKQCFEIIKQKNHLTEEGLLKLINLKSSLNLGLSENLKKAFPNVVPVDRPKYSYKGITDPFWVGVAGFTSGDGSFNVTSAYQGIGTGLRVVLKFSINLHSREEELLKGIAVFLKSSITSLSNSSVVIYFKDKKLYKSENTVCLSFSKYSDIVNIIIPFFEKYPIVGIKSFDFDDFKKVAGIIKTKEHLTLDGFNKILKIKSSMNLNRKMK